MKDRQPCQSEAEARLSSGSAIAVPAITISLKSSLSAVWEDRRKGLIAPTKTLTKRASYATKRNALWSVI